MAEVKTPRVGRSASTSRGVTVAASQKSKPKHAPFKFLRKDEGRLSYTCQPDSPVSGACSHNNLSQGGGLQSDRPASRSLREAIASNMRKGKNQDPFAEVVVAVPKRAPPPNSAARDGTEVVTDCFKPKTVEQSRQQQQQQLATKQYDGESNSEEREVSDNMVIVAKPRQHTHYSEEPDRSQDFVGHCNNTSLARNTLRRGDEHDDMNWQQQQPSTILRGRDAAPDNGVFRRPLLSRYVDAVGQDDYAQGGHNFFRPSHRQEFRYLREENDLVEQLEGELLAAKEERERYYKLNQQLGRDRQRLDDYRTAFMRQVEEERAELDAMRASEQRRAKKDNKLIEERYRSTLDILKSEREANQKLTQENELLQQQLEGITTRMREAQKLHKAETARLRREIESLTRRNEELLEMTKEQQISALVSNAKLSSPSQAPQILLANRPQTSASETSAWRNSEDSRELIDSSSIPDKKFLQKRRDITESMEQNRLEIDDVEQEHLEAEEVEEIEHKSVKNQEGTDSGLQELRSQRGFAGHPISTPRAQTVKARVVQRQRRASLASSTISSLRKTRRPPTAEELIADDEAVPNEYFPNDTVVFKTAPGENPNKHEVLYRSGKREIHYANGTRKIILPSGCFVLYFTNGDVKRTFSSGKSTYWYAAAKTMHTQHTNGVQVFQFHSPRQIERHLPDGKKEILYSDGVYKVIFADGREETILPEEG